MRAIYEADKTSTGKKKKTSDTEKTSRLETDEG